MQKVTDAFNNIITWVITSSADPTGLSLTIKGALLLTIPWIMSIVGFEHLNLGQDQITAIFDGVANFVQGALMTVGYAIAVYGVVRKAFYTIFPPKSV